MPRNSTALFALGLAGVGLLSACRTVAESPETAVKSDALGDDGVFDPRRLMPFQDGAKVYCKAGDSLDTQLWIAFRTADLMGDAQIRSESPADAWDVWGSAMFKRVSSTVYRADLNAHVDAFTITLSDANTVRSVAITAGDRRFIFPTCEFVRRGEWMPRALPSNEETPPVPETGEGGEASKTFDCNGPGDSTTVLTLEHRGGNDYSGTFGTHRLEFKSAALDKIVLGCSSGMNACSLHVPLSLFDHGSAEVRWFEPGSSPADFTCKAQR